MYSFLPLVDKIFTVGTYIYEDVAFLKTFCLSLFLKFSLIKKFEANMLLGFYALRFSPPLLLLGCSCLIYCENIFNTLQVRCLHCNGDGFSSEYDYKERCFYCRSSAHGFGRLDCLRCKASGRLICQPCEGTGLMIYFILLTITWYSILRHSIEQE